MPLSINVGLSRKASKDYQSTGVSINVTAELDQSLLAKPDDLQLQVAHLYAQAESAMEQQVANMGERTVGNQQTYGRRDSRPASSNGGYNHGNGNGNGNGNGYRRSNGNGNGGGMTDSQRRAITAIARRLNIDPTLEARDVIGADLDDLSVRQASELIDHLKGMQPAGHGGNNGNGR